jgi:tetratricopeptide (TPR) repeat protein
LVFALAFRLAPLAFCEDSYIAVAAEDRQKLMEEHYARAIQYFNDKNYSRAIHHWEQILKLDPDQTSPASLIKQARAKLSEQLGPMEESLDQAVAAGQYETALAKASELADLDPTHPRYKPLKARLQAVNGILSSETGAGKVPRLIRKALSAHLSIDENPKVALSAARYARDLAPKGPAPKLASYLEGEYSDLAKREVVAPGMSVVEHKLFIALNNIYEGRYDLAVFACNEVLEIEPDNVLALKRKGSAYFALNQKDKAREIWQQALKLTPDDAEIKKFLAAK